MNILSEIIETADNIMTALSETDFFENNIFCDPMTLRRNLEVQMQRNWEQTGDMYLSDSEFIQVVKESMMEGIRSELEQLSEKGIVIPIGRDKNGEQEYKINPIVPLLMMPNLN